jgi:hypothetical protein
MLHGEVLHEPSQLPGEQLHVPPEHEVVWRAVPVPGSAMAGPPFGVPPLEPMVVPLPPPHATYRSENANVAISVRKANTPFPIGEDHIG